MTRVCAVITNRIVVPVRIDVDVAVPMVTNVIVGIVEQDVVLVRGKPAAGAVLFHAVTPGANVVWCTRYAAMVDGNGHIEVVRTVGRITVTESAVEGKDRN